MFAARSAAVTAAIALTATTAVAPAWAHTTVIATLGTSPLLGSNAGSAALRAHVNEKSGLFDDAGVALGLTPEQRRELRFRINSDHLAAVTVPRHLDAMTWASGGRVRVIRDVQIPAGTTGWETDLTENGQVIALFIPARCGNLSVVRRAAPRVAAARVVAPMTAPVAAVAAPAPAAPVAEGAPAAAPLPAPVDVAAVPAPPPLPRGFHVSPFAALLPALFGIRSGGSNNSGPAVTTTVYPAPGTSTVTPPGTPGTPGTPGIGTPGTPGTPGTGTPGGPGPNVAVVPTAPPVAPPPNIPGGSVLPPPPPPPGVGTVPCGPNPCK